MLLTSLSAWLALTAVNAESVAGDRRVAGDRIPLLCMAGATLQKYFLFPSAPFAPDVS